MKPEIESALSILTDKLKRESLAESTERNYYQASKRFLEYFSEKDFQKLNQDDVSSYIKFLEDRKHLKPQTINLDLNGIAFLLTHVFLKQIDLNLIPRKRRPIINLPETLSPSETKLLLEKISFEKHRLMIMLLYGCGLTPSQLCGIKLKDVSFEHKQIRVIGYNRHKSSNVLALPDKIIPSLRQYLDKETPSTFLFEGRKEGTKYSTRIVNYAFSEAMRETGIKKPLSLKDLRHSYAIHLRDHGYPIKPILDNWGTTNALTYKRYCQLGITNPKSIPSPLDLLYSAENIDPIDETVLRNLIARIASQDERDYFNEAAKCMKAGALRGTVILIWEATIRNIQQRCLRYLPALNAALQKYYPKAKQVDTVDDFAYIKESLVLEATVDIGLFDKPQKETLKDCLDLRNHCGHPGNYSPGSQKVMAFLEDIIRIVY
jgi:integrase